MKKNTKPEFKNIFRQKAEEQLQLKKPKEEAYYSESEKIKMFHELQVHQIELEMQHEELLLAIEKAEIASEKYITLFDFAPSGYITLAKTNNITALNHAAGELFGIARGNLISKNILQFIAEESKKDFINFLDLVYASSIKQSITIKLLKKDNSVIDVSLRAHLVPNKEECNIIADDVTEKVKEKEKLNMLSLAIEQSPSSIVITDLNGNIEYVNKKFTDISGYQFEEVIGKNPRILKSEYTSLEVYKSFWETIKSGKTWEGEFYNKNKTGEYYWESAKISPIINVKGETTHYLAIKVDITEKKLNEIKMKNISWYQSHECRSPLTNIMAIVEELKLESTLEQKLSLLKLLDESTKKLDSVMHAIVYEANRV